MPKLFAAVIIFALSVVGFFPESNAQGKILSGGDSSSEQPDIPVNDPAIARGKLPAMESSKSSGDVAVVFDNSQISIGSMVRVESNQPAFGYNKPKVSIWSSVTARKEPIQNEEAYIAVEHLQNSGVFGSETWIRLNRVEESGSVTDDSVWIKYLDNGRITDDFMGLTPVQNMYAQ